MRDPRPHIPNQAPPPPGHSPRDAPEQVVLPVAHAHSQVKRLGAGGAGGLRRGRRRARIVVGLTAVVMTEEAKG